MKNLIYLLMIILAETLIGCSAEQPDSVGMQDDKKEYEIERDSLIVRLNQLNDSLLMVCRDEETRSFQSLDNFMELMAHIHVVAADVKGAIKGAKWGLKVFGISGAILGATILGALYSTCAAIMDYSSLPISRNAYDISQHRIELAYACARADSVMYLNYNNVEIYIPSKYKSAYDVGKYHNITLNYLFRENLPIVSLEDGYTNEELKMLHSNEFTSECNYAIENPQILSSDFMLSNYSREERIVQLFLDVLYKYPANYTDVQELINRYIALIESDANITEYEKIAVYSSLSTAAYSVNYWSTVQE